MADTRRTDAALATLFADNTSGAISAQDLRDFLESRTVHVAAAAPTASDDETAGFDVGHVWKDTASTPDSFHMCMDASTGAAVWAQIYPASAAWGAISGTLADQTDLQSALDGKLEAGDDAADLGSAAATDGYVLTADGAGGAAWEAVAGSGDMTKAAYDTNDDGTVDSADEAARVVEAVATDTDSTATHAFDLSTGTIHRLTLTANCTVSFTNVPTGGFGVTLILTQDGSGGHTVTWPAAVQWAGGTAPTLTTDASAVDIVTLFTPDSGTTWYGFLAGLDFS